VGRSRTVACKPRNDNRPSTIRPRDNQEQGEILDMNPLLIVYGEEDNDSRDSHCKTAQDECESVADAVGEGGNEHGEGERYDPGWDGVELGLNRVITVAVDDGRGEIGVALWGYIRLR